MYILCKSKAPSQPIMKTQLLPARVRSRGFALVVTLSLMILLTVIAVGLLSLASISLRATSGADARQRAKSNARLALVLAIGALQKNLGPDQRISAPASLIDVKASPGMTGAWESWAPDPLGGTDYSRRRAAGGSTEIADGEFLGWLASATDGALAADPAAPPKPPADGVALLPVTAAAAADAGKVASVRIRSDGSLAWAVVDEGVKARFDLPVEAKALDGSAESRLRAAGRDAVESMDGLAALRLDAAQAARTISLAGAEIVASRDSVRIHREDITPYSSSVLCNVAAGGLKADLTRAFEAEGLPADLAERRLYSQTSTPFSDADPYMSGLAAYYRLYKIMPDRTTPARTSVPDNFSAFSDSRGGPVANKSMPKGALILPVISKVQVVFSLISREAHAHWFTTIPKNTGDPNRKYMVYLIYTPVITVSNPYDVPLVFNDLKVTFRNLPVSFRMFRNGMAQTNNRFLLGQTHTSSQTNPGFDDPFTVTVGNSPGRSGGAVTLKPGEARVFGVTHSAESTFGSMTNFLWQNDLDKSATLKTSAGPGWDFRSGFIVDWLAPSGAGRAGDNHNLGVFGVSGSDTVDVECAPMMPSNSGGRFSVEIEANVAGSRRPTRIGFYDYKYGNENRLREIFEQGRNPLLGPVTYPFRRERPWKTSELYQSAPDTTKIKDWTGPKQFAVFTVSDRTAQDSQYPGKPGRQSSFVHNVLEMDATSTHPGRLPMEVSLLPIRTEGTNTVGSIDADGFDRAYFYSGTRQVTGAVSAPTYQMPVSPLVNLADFRHANLAAGGFLPLTSYTVGESAAPAMIEAGKVRTPSGFGYDALDHAWLANSRLWDGYYLSALVTEDATRAFLGGSPLLHNPRYTPYATPGTTRDAAATALLGDSGWKSASAHQLLRGGFNVNSTSIPAWKAVLSAHTGAPIPVLNPLDLTSKSTTADLLPVLRTVTPTAGDIDAMPGNANRWGGFRNLSAASVDKLATAIVAQIRKEGPFLSMSDFLNRRLVSESDEQSSGGPLELAIAKSGVNDIPGGVVNRAVTAADAAAMGFANKTAAAGDTEEGSRARITQGDLLSMVGASLTVRSDTFTIRAYGEAKDVSGKNTLSRAWCEAVVQRLPAWVDPADTPEIEPAAASPANRRFGRRFEVISFRWLAPGEV